MHVSDREILKSRAKEAFYALAPLALAGAAMRAAMPGSSPFEPPVIERRAIFIHVPKAAGSSVKTELYGRPMGGHRRIVEFMAYDPGKTRDFFKFCFVRNPWDRMLSAYSYLRQGEGASWRDRQFADRYIAPTADFAAFVAALERPRFRRAVMSYDHFRPQTYWTCLPGAKDHAMDFVGRFEAMDAGMAEIRDRLKLPARDTARARPSSHAPYREAYDARSRETVGELYLNDCKLFDYTF